MLFFVRFDVTQPANVSNKDLIETWIREAEAAIGAMDAGAVPHLWKVAGQRVVLGVVDLPTAEDLDRALGGLPIIRDRPTSVVARRPSARLLAIRRAALGLQPPRARGARRLRRPARALHLEGACDPAGEALERQRAVACLRAGVLGDGPHDRAAAVCDPRLVRLAERVRRGDVEARLDP